MVDKTDKKKKWKKKEKPICNLISLNNLRQKMPFLNIVVHAK